MDWDWYKMNDAMGQFMSFNFVNDKILNNNDGAVIDNAILDNLDNNDEDDEE